MAEIVSGREERAEIGRSLTAVKEEAKTLLGRAALPTPQGMGVIAQVQAEAQSAIAFALLSLADEVADLRDELKGNPNV